MLRSPISSDLLQQAELAGLLRRARAGEEAAFATFYDRTASWALARVRRLVTDGWAEDVLAEVYLQVWRSLGEFDPARGEPLAWLATIARSRALDRLRHERTRPGGQHWVTLEEAVEPLACERPGPEERAARAEDWLRLERTMLQLLSPRERMVLGLAYFRDCSHGEIAALTRLPLGTVKTLLNRSQQKLRAALCEVPAPADARVPAQTR